MESLVGKVAWIIGGSGGIGEAIVYELAKKGVHVAIGYFSEKEKAEEIAASCMEKYFVRALSFFCDVKVKSSVENAYNHIVDALGYPSILIYAAGITQSSLFQDYAEFDIDEMIGIHVKGALYVIQKGLPSMLDQKQGRIVCISSIWGEYGGATEVLYSTVKGAQNSLVKSLAKELAPSGITVNAVSPGAINTSMITKHLTKGDQYDLVQQIPLNRLGEPEEVAPLVSFLCLKEASYLTGQVIHVNGGWNG